MKMGGPERAILGILGVAMVDGGRVGQGPSLLRHLDRMERASLANATLVQGSWQTTGGEEKSRNQLPRFRARPSLRELRSASASRHANYARPPQRNRAAISLSRLGGWEWQWEWWVEELTEGTRFERRGEGRKGKVNDEFGSKQGTRLITLQRQKDRVKVYGW